MGPVAVPYDSNCDAHSIPDPQKNVRLRWLVAIFTLSLVMEPYLGRKKEKGE